MVITMLEASVTEEKIPDLERAYREGTADLPPEIDETFLVRDTSDPTLFRIVTLWDSRETVERLRASGETPKGVLIFQAAGASPSFSMFDVVVHNRHV